MKRVSRVSAHVHVEILLSCLVCEDVDVEVLVHGTWYMVDARCYRCVRCFGSVGR